MTRTLYIAKIPLLMDEEFDGFPFTLLRATADVELTSRSSPDGKIVYKPNLMLHEEERRHNICLQDVKWAPKVEGESQENWLKRKMDKLRLYDFISPYPEVAYLFEEKNFYCPRFRVSFLIEEEGFPKFIQTQLPMLLLAILATINLWIDVNERMAARAPRTHDFIVGRTFVPVARPFNAFHMNVRIQIVRPGIGDKSGPSMAV